MELCKYKNIFGKVNEGVHEHKIFGISTVDTVCTIILAFIINYYFNINFWTTLLVLFILAELCHYLFCVDTAFIKFVKTIIY